MRSFSRVLALASMVGALSLAQAAPASAACLGFSGTADGMDQQTAVSRSQSAVADAVSEYKAQKRLGAPTLSPMRAKPQPYWRDSVRDELFVKPDIVTGKIYTVCWKGVVSPFVCTSGSKACW
jgi:hypothetical protein